MTTTALVVVLQWQHPFYFVLCNIQYVTLVVVGVWKWSWNYLERLSTIAAINLFPFSFVMLPVALPIPSNMFSCSENFSSQTKWKSLFATHFVVWNPIQSDIRFHVVCSLHQNYHHSLTPRFHLENGANLCDFLYSREREKERMVWKKNFLYTLFKHNVFLKKCSSSSSVVRRSESKIPLC